MWICISDGFVSIVEHRDDPGRVLVRARRREHLEAFLGDNSPSILLTPVMQTPRSDYRWRVEADRAFVAQRLAKLLMDVRYTNFKNSVRDDEYHHACSDIWRTLGRLQEGGPYGAGVPDAGQSELFGSARDDRFVSESWDGHLDSEGTR